MLLLIPAACPIRMPLVVTLARLSETVESGEGAIQEVAVTRDHSVPAVNPPEVRFVVLISGHIWADT